MSTKCRAVLLLLLVIAALASAAAATAAAPAVGKQMLRHPNPYLVSPSGFTMKNAECCGP